jgi:hypothetical protein
VSEYHRLPAWVLRLVSDIERHEDEHPAGDQHFCVQEILSRVPDGVRTYAEGWAAGQEVAAREFGERK